MIDCVEVRVIAGRGGDGCVSFRREKYVPRGGPDGGDGGEGGDVVLVSDGSVGSLRELARRKVYRAGRGEHGQGARRHGRRGDDAVVRVPVGTQVRGLGESVLVADLSGGGEQAVVVARGGLGGRGNAWFARAEWQVPRIAQRGHRGEDVQIELELKLVSDVAIVGLPNVGKSSLLRAISAARPRVAEYPFTTVEPVLGVVGVGFESFVVADMPAVVEGAHRGAGLGVQFLRHVERTRLLLHLVDGSREDPVWDVEVVKRQLAQYSGALLERSEVVVVNKVDLPGVEARMGELVDAFRRRGIEPQFVSAAERRGTDDLLERIADVLSRQRWEGGVEAGREVRPRAGGRRFKVYREGQGFRVEGETAVAFAEMMPVEVEEGRQELWWRLGRWGVSAALRRAGAGRGDRVRLGEVEVEWPG